MGKFYAIRAGRQTGIFTSWDECKEYVTGFPGAKYKSFKNEDDAKKYLQGEDTEAKSKVKVQLSVPEVFDGEIHAYTDGSYDNDLGYTSYGVVLVENYRVEPKTRSGALQDKYGSRNVTGEIYGVMEAIEYGVRNHKSKVTIFHDYEGMAKWAVGDWKAKSEVAVMYKNFFDKQTNNIKVDFVHVKAHTGNYHNELADKLASNELKSLKPAEEDEWGYRSYKVTDINLYGTLKRIKNDFEEFKYTKSPKSNHDVIRCTLNDDSITMKKYHFENGNGLFIQKNQSDKLFYMLISYLTEYEKVDIVVKTLNANLNKQIEKDELSQKLYSISPSLNGKNIKNDVYKMLIQTMYHYPLLDSGFLDYSHFAVPSMRAIEGVLKVATRDHLGFEPATKGIAFYERDASNLWILQAAHKSRIDVEVAEVMEKCYNVYSKIRNSICHIGDVDLEDTFVIATHSDCNSVIENAVKLIEEYYLL